MHIVTVNYSYADEQTSDELNGLIDAASELANSDGGEWVDLDWDRQYSPKGMTINGVAHFEPGDPEHDIYCDVQHYLDLAINSQGN
jgi:hypothetical protein